MAITFFIIVIYFFDLTAAKVGFQRKKKCFWAAEEHFNEHHRVYWSPLMSEKGVSCKNLLSLESSLGWWRHGGGWSCVRVCKLGNKCVMFLRLSVNGHFRSPQKAFAPLCPPLSIVAVKPRFTAFCWVAAEIFKEMKLNRNIAISPGLFTHHCGLENAWWERPILASTHSVCATMALVSAPELVKFCY